MSPVAYTQWGQMVTHISPEADSEDIEAPTSSLMPAYFFSFSGYKVKVFILFLKIMEKEYKIFTINVRLENLVILATKLCGFLCFGFLMKASLFLKCCFIYSHHLWFYSAIKHNCSRHPDIKPSLMWSDLIQRYRNFYRDWHLPGTVRN